MARTSERPDTLVVVLGGAVVGTLVRQANATLRFDYDQSYQADPEATPVSLSMPLAVRTHQDGRGRRVVTNFLWGLLPENDAVRLPYLVWMNVMCPTRFRPPRMVTIRNKVPILS